MKIISELKILYHFYKCYTQIQKVKPPKNIEIIVYISTSNSHFQNEKIYWFDLNFTNLMIPK